MHSVLFQRSIQTEYGHVALVYITDIGVFYSYKWSFSIYFIGISNERKKHELLV